MIGVKNAISSLESFLNQAQHIGLVKEYSVVLTECSDFTKIPDFERILSQFVQEMTNILSSLKQNLNSSPVTETSKTELMNMESVSCGNSLDVKKHVCQIQVDESEIKRRISAFISRKRKEVDEWNVREFCSRPYVEDQNPLWEQMDSCARVDTVFVPRFGSKSHVKVSKVENRWGPQTHIKNEISKKIKREPDSEHMLDQNDISLDNINERLQNMESHVNLKSESSLRSNIFQRLKDLEDRILFLEGISPDYFHLSGSDVTSPKKKTYSEKEKLYSNWSVDDLQKRIQTVRESLKAKSLQIKKESSE